ncbi:MAG TPA: DUF4013 domain-containing protein [bacterium]|nr:DUF4013 domain-containing protein [bacterium]
MTFQFARPFQFAMQDPAWLKKIAILALCFFIPFVGPFAALGYYQAMMKNVADGDESLPEWDRFGEYIGRGFKAFAVILLYMLPSVVVYVGSMVVSMAMIALLTDKNGQGIGGTIGGLLMMAGGVLAFVLFLGGLLMVPAGIAKMVDEDSLAAALKPVNVFKFVFGNFVNVLMAIVVGMIGGMIAPLGMIACFIGIYATIAFSMSIRAHAWGQVIALSREREYRPIVTGKPRRPVPTDDGLVPA